MREQETDAGGRGSGGEAAAVCAADRSGRQQQRGVSAGRDRPQDGEPVAVWAEGPEFRRGACHLSAGEDHRIEAAEPAVSLRAGTDPDRRSAGGEDERAGDRCAVGACAVDDQPRDPAQQRPGRPLPAPSRRAGRAAAGVQAAHAADRWDAVLAEVVQRLLAKRWSPEQVAHELRVLFAGQPSRWLCKETIYQAIYDTAVALTRPARRRRRRRRLQGLQRRGRLTAMRMIDERPAEVEDRVQAGHWEGDLIMGAGNRSAIGTLVERTTRYLILLPFADGDRDHRRGPPGDHRRARGAACGAAADADLGSGQGARPAPADHRRDRHRACSSATRTRRGSAAATRT